MPIVTVRHSVPVNGSQLRDDRLSAGLSQDALLASCDLAFHIGTLRRAERGENVSKIYLASLARALGFELARYVRIIAPEQADMPGVDISGEWHAFFVQDHAGAAPYAVEEKASFQQNGTSISGYTESHYRGKPIREIFTGMSVRGDMLMGQSIVEGWGGLAGVTSIQAVISRGNDWIDGYATWYDSDTRDICCSRYIMVRKGASFEDDFKAEAVERMKAECRHFAARR